MVTQLFKFTKNQAKIEKKKEKKETYLTRNTGTIHSLLQTLSHTTVPGQPQALPFLTVQDLALAIPVAWPPALELEACFFLSVGHTCIKEHKACDAIL